MGTLKRTGNNVLTRVLVIAFVMSFLIFFLDRLTKFYVIYLDKINSGSEIYLSKYLNGMLKKSKMLNF